MVQCRLSLAPVSRSYLDIGLCRYRQVQRRRCRILDSLIQWLMLCKREFRPAHRKHVLWRGVDSQCSVSQVAKKSSRDRKHPSLQRSGGTLLWAYLDNGLQGLQKHKGSIVLTHWWEYRLCRSLNPNPGPLFHTQKAKHGAISLKS